MIGDDVVVTVLEVRGDIVRLGIDAPRDLKVHREEVYLAVKEANAAAAAAAATSTEESEAALAESLRAQQDAKARHARTGSQGKVPRPKSSE